VRAHTFADIGSRGYYARLARINFAMSRLFLIKRPGNSEQFVSLIRLDWLRRSLSAL